MGGLTPGEGRAVVHSRAHEWMVELELGAADTGERRLLGCVERLRADPELCCRREHGRDLSRVVGGCNEQQGLRLLGQRLRTPEKRMHKPSADRHRGRQRGSHEKLCLGQCGWKFEQRKRVTAGALDQQLARLLRERDPCLPREQRTGRIGVEAPNVKLGQRRRLELPRFTLTSRKQQHDPLRLQPPRDEHQRIGGSVIEPLGIVDQAEERTSLRGLRQQAQDGERDQKPIITSACT